MNPRQQTRQWLSDKTGIELNRGGVGRTLDDLVKRRCRALNCEPDAYWQLAREDAFESELLTNALTVVYTWFFRDGGQMAAIESVLITCAARRDGPVRVWVPGCATGEDCFSIAVLARERNIAVSILGTDINTEALSRARAARYPKASMREVSSTRQRCFRRANDGWFEIDPKFRESVQFQYHNLSTKPPVSPDGHAWDLVLCRNVLIYFRPERAVEVFDALGKSLASGGVVMLGASEVVYDVPRGMFATYHAGRLVLQRELPGGTARSNTTSGISPMLVPSSAGQLAPDPSLGALRHLASPRLSRAPIAAVPSQARELTADRDDALSEGDGPASRHLRCGHLLLDRGRVAEALLEYELATRSCPTSPEAHMYQGVARYLRGEVESAAHDLRAALFLDGGLWQAAFYLALSYESLGLLDDALREYRHVVTLCERLPEHAPNEHPLLVAWQSDVLALARRRLESGGAPAVPGQFQPALQPPAERRIRPIR